MKATGVSPFGGGYECEIHSLGDRFYVSLQLGNDTSDRERTADSNLGLQDLRTEDAFTRIAVFCCVQRRDEHHAQVSSCRRQCACLCAVSCAVCMAIHPIYLSLHPSIDPSLSLPLPPSLPPSLPLSLSLSLVFCCRLPRSVRSFSPFALCQSGGLSRRGRLAGSLGQAAHETVRVCSLRNVHSASCLGTYR